MAFKPFHTVFGESEPFWSPGGNTWLVGHLTVELLGELVRAWTDDQSAVVGTAWVEIHQALETYVFCKYIWLVVGYGYGGTYSGSLAWTGLDLGEAMVCFIVMLR